MGCGFREQGWRAAAQGAATSACCLAIVSAFNTNCDGQNCNKKAMMGTNGHRIRLLSKKEIHERLGGETVPKYCGNYKTSKEQRLNDGSMRPIRINRSTTYKLHGVDRPNAEIRARSGSLRHHIRLKTKQRFPAVDILNVADDCQWWCLQEPQNLQWQPMKPAVKVDVFASVLDEAKAQDMATVELLCSAEKNLRLKAATAAAGAAGKDAAMVELNRLEDGAQGLETAAEEDAALVEFICAQGLGTTEDIAVDDVMEVMTEVKCATFSEGAGTAAAADEDAVALPVELLHAGFRSESHNAAAAEDAAREDLHCAGDGGQCQKAAAVAAAAAGDAATEEPTCADSASSGNEAQGHNAAADGDAAMVELTYAEGRAAAEEVVAAMHVEITVAGGVGQKTEGIAGLDQAGDTADGDTLESLMDIKHESTERAGAADEIAAMMELTCGEDRPAAEEDVTAMLPKQSVELINAVDGGHEHMAAAVVDEEVDALRYTTDIKCPAADGAELRKPGNGRPCSDQLTASDAAVDGGFNRFSFFGHSEAACFTDDTARSSCNQAASCWGPAVNQPALYDPWNSNGLFGNVANMLATVPESRSTSGQQWFPSSAVMSSLASAAATSAAATGSRWPHRGCQQASAAAAAAAAAASLATDRCGPLHAAAVAAAALPAAQHTAPVPAAAAVIAQDPAWEHVRNRVARAQAVAATGFKLPQTLAENRELFYGCQLVPWSVFNHPSMQIGNTTLSVGSPINYGAFGRVCETIAANGTVDQRFVVKICSGAEGCFSDVEGVNEMVHLQLHQGNRGIVQMVAAGELQPSRSSNRDLDPVFNTRPVFYMLLERMEDSVADWIRQFRDAQGSEIIPVSHILGVLKACVMAVTNLHRRPGSTNVYAHRDIKSHNILMSRCINTSTAGITRYRVCFGDLDAMASYPHGSNQKFTGVRGTKEYMAPEILDLEQLEQLAWTLMKQGLQDPSQLAHLIANRDYDETVDVFSLMMTLLDMLSGLNCAGQELLMRSSRAAADISEHVISQLQDLVAGKLALGNITPATYSYYRPVLQQLVPLMAGFSGQQRYSAHDLLPFVQRLIQLYKSVEPAGIETTEFYI